MSRDAMDLRQDALLVLDAIEDLNHEEPQALMARMVLGTMGNLRMLNTALSLVVLMANLWADSLDDGTTADEILARARRHIESMQGDRRGHVGPGAGAADDGARAGGAGDADKGDQP